MNHRSKLSRAISGFSALVVFAALFYSLPRAKERVVGELQAVTDAQNPQTDVMQAFRAEREDVRKLEILQLSALAADEGASAELRAGARGQLLRLTEAMETETTLEGVLRMRGFEDAVVTVHTDSVNVLVRARTLSQSESAAILELVMRETGQSGGNVKIITVGNSQLEST